MSISAKHLTRAGETIGFCQCGVKEAGCDLSVCAPIPARPCLKMMGIGALLTCVSVSLTGD